MLCVYPHISYCYLAQKWRKMMDEITACICQLQYLKLQSPIRSRGVSETCGGDCFSHHGLPKAPKQVDEPKSNFKFSWQIIKSPMMMLNEKNVHPLHQCFFCFCMFFPSLLTKNVQDLRDSQPTNQLNQPNPRRPQAAATSASSASQKHEVHPSQRTVNEPWNGGTVDPGKKGSRDTRRIFHTHWYTFSLRIQNILKYLEVCVMLVQAKHKDKQ